MRVGVRVCVSHYVYSLQQIIIGIGSMECYLVPNCLPHFAISQKPICVETKQLFDFNFRSCSGGAGDKRRFGF